MKSFNSILPFFKQAPAFDAVKFLEAHEEPAVNSFRINPKKIKESPFDDATLVPWCTDGFYVAARPKYVYHPYWHGGAFYVQEASSMFLQEVLKQVLPLQNNLRVLDACAAPGGKSTLISSILTPESVLVSNEVIKSRVNVLLENLTKWGNPNNIITNSDSQQFAKLPPVFDCIVVDAPCSGSGLFRKDPNALNEWSEESVKLCSERQQRIVGNLIPCLKQDGILIYSTCSYSVEENEDMVHWFCKEHQLEMVEVSIPEAWNIINSEKGCYRFYPYNLKGEGFFLAVLRKKEPISIIKDHGFKTLKMIKPDKAFTQFLNSELQHFVHNETIFSASENLIHLTEILRSCKINMIRCGVETGEFKGNKFIPSHTLAVNEIISPSIETIEVDEKNALNYLRKNTISTEASLGYKIIQYKGVNLGWVNVMQNRCNNMYPTNWRLLN